MTKYPTKKTDSPPYITHKIATKSLFEYTDLYSDEDIQRICEQHKIDYEQHGKLLGATLDHAAKRYAVLKQRESVDLSSAETGKHLTGLRRAAKELATDIAQLPPKVREVFDRADAELQDELNERTMQKVMRQDTLPSSRMEQAGTGSFTAIRNGEIASGWQDHETRIEYVAFKDIEAALKQIQLICETGLNYLQPERGGRPENKAVYAWVKTVSDFWVKDLKRPYKVDGYKGEVVTEAGNFLTDCLKPLDLTAIELLYSQMRRYRDKA